MLLRVLALILIVVFSFTVYPATVAADSAGIFDNAATLADLDDDFDEALRRLRPPAAADSAAAVFHVSASPTLHLSLVFAGAGPMSWTGRPAADRGPPGGLTRHQISPAPPRAALAARFQPDPEPLLLLWPVAPPAHHRLRSERNA